MHQPMCPTCKRATAFEVNRNVLLARNLPEVVSLIEYVDFIQCIECGTVVGVVNARTQQIEPTGKI